MSLIRAKKDRGKTIDIVINDGAGSPITPGANDVIRFIVGRQGRLGVNNANAEFVVASDAPTAAGSTFTKGGGVGGGASNRLRMDASDLNFSPGIYTALTELFDNADAGELKEVSSQVFFLEDI